MQFVSGGGPVHLKSNINACVLEYPPMNLDQDSNSSTICEVMKYSHLMEGQVLQLTELLTGL